MAEEKPIVIPPMPGEVSAKLLDEEQKRIREHAEKMERVRSKVVAIFVEEGLNLKQFATIVTKILEDNNKVVDSLTIKEIVERHAS